MTVETVSVDLLCARYSRNVSTSITFKNILFVRLILHQSFTVKHIFLKYKNPQLVVINEKTMNMWGISIIQTHLVL